MPLETVSKWYSGEVLYGDQYGRTLGFPTANLDAALLKHVEKEGVYACNVRLGSQNYRGALYLGPRIVLHETKRVLEINIIDFDQEIYGETLEFQLGAFIRPPLDFDSLDALKAQFKEDVSAARRLSGSTA
jgi:riboflavin kinase/FMN adenylyltransferase